MKLDNIPVQNNILENYFNSDKSSNLTKILNKEINIAVWKRKIDEEIQTISKEIVNNFPNLDLCEVIESKDVVDFLIKNICSNKKFNKLYKDISNLVNIFCTLSDKKNAWLRINTIDKPMCPRFHVDYNKLRLLTTYCGPSTEWLPNCLVDRNKLGSGSSGLSDEFSGLYNQKIDIQQISTGDVAVIKGEAWNDNDGQGLVHRSPHTNTDYERLYLTIDFPELYESVYQNF